MGLRKIVLSLIVGIVVTVFTGTSQAKHYTGENCFRCHSNFKAAGSVYQDSEGQIPFAGAKISFVNVNGGEIVIGDSDTVGNIYTSVLPDGCYLIRLGEISSRTWHSIPLQGGCNACHLPDKGNDTGDTIQLHQYHTAIPSDNNCTNCHHFPASMSYDRLTAPGVLNATAESIPLPASFVEIMGVQYPFEPNEYNILTLRPDIFAPGWFSMFDVILAVAEKNGINIDYYYDESRKTHFITSVDGVEADYWYHFSYDAGTGSNNELRFRRAYRWDEALWRSGVSVRIVTGEDLWEIKSEYLEEIEREKILGHVIPNVSISINPSNYQENPSGSGRITVKRTFANVEVTPHNLRATGYPSPYSKPFQPGVITSIDVLLSLKDKGMLDVVTSVFYNHFAGHYIDSYYVVELGFPGVGTAHSSGRQGFVYTISNGTPNRLTNNADRKFHMTSDISVVHAPDFCTWRWAELGEPYYESNDPTTSVEDERRILEDYESIGRGFNLHAPLPNPFNETCTIPFNVFLPGHMSLTIHNSLGQKVGIVFSGNIENIGFQSIRWTPEDISSGVYFIVMENAISSQVKSVTYVK